MQRKVLLLLICAAFLLLPAGCAGGQSTVGEEPTAAPAEETPAPAGDYTYAEAYMRYLSVCSALRDTVDRRVETHNAILKSRDPDSYYMNSDYLMLVYVPFSTAYPALGSALGRDNRTAAENALRERMENAYILRPPYLYGKYESLYREPFIFDCARGDRKCYIPEKEMSLQFFNVRDLCRFMELILETQPENKVFNVGNPQTVTVKEWVTLCYEAAGKTPEILRVSDSFPQRSYFPFHNYDYRLDVSKMLALMPELTPLDEGLKEEYEWYAETDPPMDRKSYFEYIDNNLA